MAYADTLNPFWRYAFHYIHYQAYFFQGIMVNEFAARLYSRAARADDSTECSCVYEVLYNADCSVSGHKILELYNIGIDKFGVRLAAVMTTIVILKIFAWLTLRLRRVG
jgi:hypothetical protein